MPTVAMATTPDILAHPAAQHRRGGPDMPLVQNHGRTEYRGCKAWFVDDDQ
jgi:hypothetical protein